MNELEKEVDDTVLARLNTAEMQEAVLIALMTPMEGTPGDEDCLWGIPTIVEGEPGIGKTARTKQLAKLIQWPCKSLFASQHPPEDFAGALIPDGKGDANQICPLQQVREICKVGYGIIYLDEINGASPLTQGALQSFIHERIAGDQPIPGRVRILGAANPEEIATGGYRIAPALANRICWLFDKVPSAEEFRRWNMGAPAKSSLVMRMATDRIDLERLVVKEWLDQFPVWQGLVNSFTDAKEDLLHDRPSLKSKRAAKMWPSPRTWDYVQRLCTTCSILGAADRVRDALVQGCVGRGAAESFDEYRQKMDLPNPVEVLDGKWKIDPSRIDTAIAAYSSTMAYVVNRSTYKDKKVAAIFAWEALERLFKHDMSDLMIDCVDTLVNHDLGIQSGDDELIKAAKKVLVPLSQSGHYKIMDEKAVP